MQEDRQHLILEVLREATRGSEYENRLWLVGGYVRDKALGKPSAKDDIDIVLEGDALALARLLHERGATQNAPVIYPRFGTAMVRVLGGDVELVTARKESYGEGSRKPAEVKPATLEEDARRRDFTINTLLENLHTKEIRDPLGSAFPDLDAGVIRTPTQPFLTFKDDPLRMLRAVRFAVRLAFRIEPETKKAIKKSAERLRPPTVSLERIRDEFSKILMADKPAKGLELLRETRLLAQFAPELLEMEGVTQNEFHAYPVWEHTLVALDSLVQSEPHAPLLLRLAVLFHDIGKPRTRSEGPDGRVHFYHHEDTGAEMAREILTRLKFSKADVDAVAQMVEQHMRIGEYKPAQWTDAAVRRFVRASGPHREDLFAIHRADVAALAAGHQDTSRAQNLRERIERLQEQHDSEAIVSPLSGSEIMALLALPAGPKVGEVKDYLTNEVIEGKLAPGDKVAAERLAKEFAAGHAASAK
ncbi:MAG TPA: HD domain-containing protein [Capsulimonadaceae bacterium]|nr:HD domain-containing protein [Capsulimonadaceae bacterium]